MPNFFSLKISLREQPSAILKTLKIILQPSNIRNEMQEMRKIAFAKFNLEVTSVYFQAKNTRLKLTKVLLKLYKSTFVKLMS